MIRVACLNYSNSVLSNFFHDDIVVEYYNDLRLLEYNKYSFLIILNDKDNIDIVKCLKIIKNKFTGIIYIIDSLYNEQIIEEIFNYGIDDYLVIPVENSYLAQKIITKQQDIEKRNKEHYKYKELFIDFNAYAIFINNVEIALTKIEFDLLKVLIINLNKAVSRQELLIKVWGYDSDDSRTLETHIKTLRKKLKNYRSNIITIWSYGYSFME